MILATIMFYIFAALTVLSALMVISAKNPVKSVLFLIFAFFNSAGLFVLLGAEFIAMLMVIVYVGAVAVLFLFVIMMLNINYEKMKEGFIHYLPLGIFMAGILLVELYAIIEYSTQGYRKAMQDILPQTASTLSTNTESIGAVLYTDYLYLFQIAGLICLGAMIGDIVLTHRERKGVKRQNIQQQLARDPSKTVELKNVESGSGV
jgi:NADH-quinone oxidoreductase subunit J